mgnify:CR=1 FL=1
MGINLPSKKENNILIEQAKQKITITDSYIEQQIESRTSNLNYKQTKSIKAAAFLPEAIIDLFNKGCTEITCKRTPAEVYNLTFFPPATEQEAIKAAEISKIKQSYRKLQEQEIQKALTELTSEFEKLEKERLEKELQAKVNAAKAELTKQLLEK